MEALAFLTASPHIHLMPSHQWSPLRIIQNPNPAATPVPNKVPVNRLEDPEERKEGEGEGGPVDELGRGLVLQDRV